MKPAPKNLRQQIEWRVNGSVVTDGQWICTNPLGRGDLNSWDLQRLCFALWEAEMPLSVFLSIYHDAYAEIVNEEMAQEPSEWGMVLEYDPLRHAGYPTLEDLIDEHAPVLRNLLLNDDAVLMDLIQVEEPKYYDVGYAVHGLHEILIRDDRITLVGVAVEQDEI